MMSSVLFIHIAGGSLAVVAGYAALFAPKGGWFHRRAGMLFVYAMIAMGIGAIFVGLARGNPSWLGGPFVIYLVVTSMLTVSRTHTASRTTNIALMVLAVALALVSVAGGIKGVTAPRGALTAGGVPVLYTAIMSFVNAFVLVLCVTGDSRVLRSGLPTGTRRLRRHLWRMCYAMFTATASFFLGQAKVIPEPLRIEPLILVLAFLPLPAMFYWLWRVRKRGKSMVTRVPVGAALQKGHQRYELARDTLEAVK